MYYKQSITQFLYKSRRSMWKSERQKQMWVEISIFLCLQWVLF